MNTFLNLTLLGIGLGFAMPLAAADLGLLCGDADVIAIGSLYSRQETSDIVSFDLAIERVLKGDTAIKTAHISHPWKRRGIVFTDDPNAPIDGRIRGIWFLKRRSNDWDAIPANGQDGIMLNLRLPAAETVPPRYHSGTSVTPLDATVIEFAAGAEATGFWRGTAVETLKTVHTPTLSTVISAYLASPDTKVQITGVAIALAQNQDTALSDLTRVWPLATDGPARADAIKSLRDSYRDVSPPAVNQLVALAVDPAFADLRAAAVHALASIHTREALPTLAALLQSTDPDEQMKGVFGLSSFANGCPVQTPDNVVTMAYLNLGGPSPYKSSATMAHFAFRRGPSDQERELIAFWRGWWMDHQTELTQ